MNDLKFAIRQLLKNPGFTVVAVITLALGIGANAVVYSWIDTVLLNSIPGAGHPRELVAIVPSDQYGTGELMSYPDTRDLAAQTRSLSGVTASEMAMLNLRRGESSEWVWGQAVMANFFHVLEIQAALGSVAFPGTDADTGNAPYAVVSHRYWQNHFGGDASVVGQHVSLNGKPFTLIGVAAEGFKGSVGGLNFDIWVPLAMGETLGVTPGLTDDKRGWHWMTVVGRLGKGSSRKSAQAEVTTIASRIAQGIPDAGPDDSLALLPMWKAPGGGQAIFLPLLRTLLVIVLLVLFLVVASVANLLLTRNTVRSREVGIRLAMGASRGRVARQLFTESLLLTGLGSALGLGLAHLGSGLLSVFFPVSHLPAAYDVEISWSVIVLTAGLALLSGLIFGFAPAWSLVRTPLPELMGEGTRGSEGRTHRMVLRRSLVAGQFAIALVVLVTAGLCLRSFSNARKLDLGFNPNGLWVAGFKMDAIGYGGAAAASFYQRLDERLRALPGVKSVSYSDHLPLGFEEGGGGSISVSGYQPRAGEQMGASLSRVMPGFFQTMQIPLHQGRDFRRSDDGDASLVAVINDSMVERYFKGRNPIGQTIQLWGADRTIVGVVGNTKHRSLNEPPANTVFVPQAQLGQWNLFAVVRSENDPRLVGKTIGSIARELDPGITVWHSISFSDFIQPAFLVPRVASVLLTGLGLIALLLATMGLYAVVAFNVSQRTRELGIRLALGSSRSEIQSLVLRQGVRLAGWGLLMGLVLAVCVSRLLRSFLIEVEPLDPFTFVATAVILVFTALSACWFPARRAANTDPMQALRAD
jgi:predicted permease